MQLAAGMEFRISMNQGPHLPLGCHALAQLLQCLEPLLGHALAQLLHALLCPYPLLLPPTPATMFMVCRTNLEAICATVCLHVSKGRMPQPRILSSRLLRSRMQACFTLRACKHHPGESAQRMMSRLWAHPDQGKAELLPGVAPGQVSEHKVVVVLDDTQDDVRCADALGPLGLLELPQLLDL